MSQSIGPAVLSSGSSPNAVAGCTGAKVFVGQVYVVPQWRIGPFNAINDCFSEEVQRFKLNVLVA